MALDTQPLSRGRRLTMLGVLAVVFAGSMGFAGYLVKTHPGGFEVVPVLEKFGFRTSEPVTLPYEIAARTGRVGKGERLVEVFAWESPKVLSPREQRAGAATFFEALGVGAPLTVESGELLGHPGVQVVGKDEQDQFTILRLAVFGKQVVAISYSGPLPYTDADKTTFDTICSTGVELRK
ncbi:MAG: hypothetical protein ACTHN5_16945 [Phycisphaerae bacterium]